MLLNRRGGKWLVPRFPSGVDSALLLESPFHGPRHFPMGCS